MTRELPARRRILMLGTNVASVDMVKYARSLGHHVTVTDYLPDDAGAKRFADATASISTLDVDALVDYAREQRIDGFLAGVNEGNIRSAIEATERLDLPFYCSSEQWDQLMDKGRFRELCIAEDVPRPETYHSGAASDIDLAKIEALLPVVVKPVDGSALRGITICREATMLRAAIAEAEGVSRTGDVLIESFVNGDEFTAAYVIVDGVPSLSSIDVRYPFAFEGMTTTFPILRVYPPEFTDAFVAECDAAVRRICAAAGLVNACLFVQGIRTNDDEFAIFEAGLRMAGEAPYRFLEAVNGVNPMKHSVEASLGLSPTYDISRDDPSLGGEVCAIASFVFAAGEVGTMSGVHDTVADLDEIIEFESRYSVGDIVVADGTLRQVGLRFIVRCASRQRLHRVLEMINDGISVLDGNGRPMVAKPDVAVLATNDSVAAD